MTTTFFLAEDAAPLLPLGTCSLCGTREDPMIAIFWSSDELGAICPECAGEAPAEGYDHIVLVDRKDKPRSAPSMHGPYSAAEAARVASYLGQLCNVESARVAPKPEWF